MAIIKNNFKINNKYNMPVDYLQQGAIRQNEFNTKADTLQRLIEGAPAGFLLKDPSNNYVCWNKDGTRVPCSDSLIRKLTEKQRMDDTEQWFKNIASMDVNEMSIDQAKEILFRFQNSAPEIKARIVSLREYKDAIMQKTRSLFELRPDKPLLAAKQINSLLNPDELADFLLLALYQTYADVTKQQKIPIFSTYLNFIQTVAAAEVNPITSNSWPKALLNQKIIQQGGTPFRTNGPQKALGKYTSEFLSTPKACEGIIQPDGSILATELDMFVNINFAKFFPFLTPEQKKSLGIKEMSLADLAWRARVAKLIVLAYERLITSAVTGHSGGLPFQELLRDITGVQLGSKPSHL